MFRPKFAWRSVAVLGVAALSLAACNNGDGGSGGSNDGEQFDGTLSLGLVLPQTGGLAPYGQGMIAAAEMAIQEVNENGGVWGNDVVWTVRDEGPAEEPEVAAAAADFMIQEGVNAVIGAASSSVSLNIIEALYNEAIIMVSPSNTGPDFTNHPYNKYYFRTAPSDIIQGSALAEEINADGIQTLGILAQQTAYGEGLANQIAQVFNGEVVYHEYYDLAQTEYSAEVAALAEADPEGIVLISYEEAKQIIPALVAAGLGPDVKQWYFVDGNRLDYSGDFEAGLLEDGQDIDYDGISGPIAFTSNGDPGRAEIGIFVYNEDNTFTRIKTVSGQM